MCLPKLDTGRNTCFRKYRMLLYRVCTGMYRVISHFRGFSLGQDTEWGYFWGLLKFQIFFGVLEIPDIFGGER